MKKKTPAKPAAKKAAPKKAAVKSAARKTAPAPKPRVKPAKPVAPVVAEPHKPGVHLPSKPAPAYAQMQQNRWAGKPPPHKLTK